MWRASAWSSSTRRASSTLSTTGPRAARRRRRRRPRRQRTCTRARRSSTTARTAWRSTLMEPSRSGRRTRRTTLRLPSMLTRPARRRGCGRSRLGRTATRSRLAPPRSAWMFGSGARSTCTALPSTRRRSICRPPPAPAQSTKSPTACGLWTCTITSWTRPWLCTVACRCCWRTPPTARRACCGSTRRRRLSTCRVRPRPRRAGWAARHPPAAVPPPLSGCPSRA
mmetsp:Transcript_16433/g.53563  ORF Transcript_16433/g.53563 Transcript_16433/m.53563 type:complete len:225 (+) Transcript_16433:529-1203(+)